MNTKLIMTMSALFMGACGIALTFAPAEIAAILLLPTQSNVEIILQILGALYFAFAMTNWTAKGNLMGGIYGRPIAIGNLSHFVIAALAVAKAYFASGHVWMLVLGVVYALFAIVFSIIFLTHPIAAKTNEPLLK